MFEQQKPDASDRRQLLRGFVKVAQVLALHATAELTSFHRGLAHSYCVDAVGAILGAKASSVSSTDLEKPDALQSPVQQRD